MTITAAAPPPVTPPAVTLGIAHLARQVFAGADLGPIFEALKARATAAPPDVGALFDLSSLAQMVGQKEEGLAVQAAALSQCRLYRRVHGEGDALHVLAIVRPGDFMANTPVDFLLEGSDFTFDLWFPDADAAIPAAVPPHDVAIVAIGESDESAPLFEWLAHRLAAWPRPVLNGGLSRILSLRRDLASGLLAGEASLLAPATVRRDRSRLRKAAADDQGARDQLPGGAFPIIARPVGSHAGEGLERLADRGALGAYLADQAADDFYVAPFVDYRGAGGQYTKLRIAFIEGRPFIVHVAISSHWMVHYLNAGMLDDVDKREREARAMEDFETGFAVRHRQALAVLAARVGLDYFGIDCAETPDGRLLVFEVDTAMIVHDMDPPDLFPYKSAHIRRLFAAFQDMLVRRAGAHL